MLELVKGREEGGREKREGNRKEERKDEGKETRQIERWEHKESVCA